MSLAIKITNATFTNFFSSLTLPDRTGLVAEFILGGTQAASVRNRANPAAPATVVGSPTYSTGYATVLNSNTGSYGFNTGVIPGNDCSVIAISSRNIGYAMHTGDTSTGSTGVWNDTAVGQFAFDNGAASGSTAQAVVPQTPPTIDSTTLFFQCGTGSVGVVGNLYVGKSGVLVSAAGTSTAGSRSANPLLIGGFDAAAFGGGAGTAKRVAYAACFNRVLTSAQVAAIYAQLTAYYANLGIAVN